MVWFLPHPIGRRALYSYLKKVQLAAKFSDRCILIWLQDYNPS